MNTSSSHLERSISLSRAASSALDALDRILANNDDASYAAIRDLLCDDSATLNASLAITNSDDYDADIDLIASLIQDIIDDIEFSRTYTPDSRQRLSILALSLSLCPLHFHDYAICFDDSLEECEIIRDFFPSYDS